MSTDPTEVTQTERDRCERIAIAALMNRGTCKQATDFGKGWNAACFDVRHRIMTEGRCITTSPVPSMIEALQAVKRDGVKLRTFHSVTITPETLTSVCDALDELNNPKEI